MQQGQIYPSLSPAPLGYCCYASQAFPPRARNTEFLPVPLSHIPQELSEIFWQNSTEVSQRSRQKGLQYAFERYVHQIKCWRSSKEEELKIERKVHCSQCKRQAAHVLTLRIKTQLIQEQQCSCTAG